MEWTQENVIEFIELYKRKEITWDPKHPIHFNKIKKQDAWKEMEKEMNRPVDECKKKMENLLSSLRREKILKTLLLHVLETLLRHHSVLCPTLFSTESISTATESSEENINIQVLLE
jgi:hypothetical protein